MAARSRRSRRRRMRRTGRPGRNRGQGVALLLALLQLVHQGSAMYGGGYGHGNPPAYMHHHQYAHPYHGHPQYVGYPQYYQQVPPLYRGHGYQPSLHAGGQVTRDYYDRPPRVVKVVDSPPSNRRGVPSAPVDEVDGGDQSAVASSAKHLVRGTVSPGNCPLVWPTVCLDVVRSSSLDDEGMMRPPLELERLWRSHEHDVFEGYCDAAVERSMRQAERLGGGSYSAVERTACRFECVTKLAHVVEVMQSPCRGGHPDGPPTAPEPNEDLAGDEASESDSADSDYGDDEELHITNIDDAFLQEGARGGGDGDDEADGPVDDRLDSLDRAIAELNLQAGVAQADVPQMGSFDDVWGSPASSLGRMSRSTSSGSLSSEGSSNSDAGTYYKPWRAPSYFELHQLCVSDGVGRLLMRNKVIQRDGTVAETAFDESPTDKPWDGVKYPGWSVGEGSTPLSYSWEKESSNLIILNAYRPGWASDELWSSLCPRGSRRCLRNMPGCSKVKHLCVPYGWASYTGVGPINRYRKGEDIGTTTNKMIQIFHATHQREPIDALEGVSSLVKRKLIKADLGSEVARSLAKFYAKKAMYQCAPSVFSTLPECMQVFSFNPPWKEATAEQRESARRDYQERNALTEGNVYSALAEQMNELMERDARCPPDEPVFVPKKYMECVSSSFRKHLSAYFYNANRFAHPAESADEFRRLHPNDRASKLSPWTEEMVSILAETVGLIIERDQNDGRGRINIREYPHLKLDFEDYVKSGNVGAELSFFPDHLTQEVDDMTWEINHPTCAASVSEAFSHITFLQTSISNDNNLHIHVTFPRPRSSCCDCPEAARSSLGWGVCPTLYHPKDATSHRVTCENEMCSWGPDGARSDTRSEEEIRNARKHFEMNRRIGALGVELNDYLGWKHYSANMNNKYIGPITTEASEDLKALLGMGKIHGMEQTVDGHAWGPWKATYLGIRAGIYKDRRGIIDQEIIGFEFRANQVLSNEVKKLYNRELGSQEQGTDHVRFSTSSYTMDIDLSAEGVAPYTSLELIQRVVKTFLNMNTEYFDPRIELSSTEVSGRKSRTLADVDAFQKDVRRVGWEYFGYENKKDTSSSKLRKTLVEVLGPREKGDRLGETAPRVSRYIPGAILEFIGNYLSDATVRVPEKQCVEEKPLRESMAEYFKYALSRRLGTANKFSPEVIKDWCMNNDKAENCPVSAIQQCTWGLLERWSFKLLNVGSLQKFFSVSGKAPKDFRGDPRESFAKFAKDNAGCQGHDCAKALQDMALDIDRRTMQNPGDYF